MEKGFWAIPKSIAKRKDLSLKAKLVAAILWTRKNSDFEAFPSRRYMAEVLGISTKTVDRGIRELKEKAGLRAERKGLRKNNRYYFPDWDESSKLSPSEETRVSTQEQTGLSTPIVREYKKDITVVDGREPSAIDVFDYFRKRVREIKGFEPEIDYGKDGKLAKKRLKKYSLNEIKDLIDWYLNSRHSDKFGASLAICLSAFMINLWKAEKEGQSVFENLYPVWQPKE